MRNFAAVLCGTMDKERERSLIGNLACFAAYAIFGFNIISCKGIALAMGLDHLTVLKVVATLLVFIGVGLVNFAPKRGSV